MSREERRVHNQPHFPERRRNARRRLSPQELTLMLAVLVFLLLLIYGNFSPAG